MSGRRQCTFNQVYPENRGEPSVAVVARGENARRAQEAVRIDDVVEGGFLRPAPNGTIERVIQNEPNQDPLAAETFALRDAQTRAT